MREIIMRYAIVAALAVFLTLLLSKEASSQAYNCGMFGMLEDNYGETYVARFHEGLDDISLESALTCEIIECNVKVFDIRHRRYSTVVWINIEHPKFDGAPYRIKYPTGSWGIISNHDN
tara:strand:+ start:892 stop:1248 length:357 start_codon:yes stop_codon:yes gene_type:complete